MSIVYEPLASRERPTELSGYVGQQHLLAPGKPLYEAYQQQRLHSMIFWGPPGTGKTTLANILAERANAQLEKLSAVMAGVKDIRAIVEKAQYRSQQFQQATVLFIDEIHRFNKSQQDALLPFVEAGDLIFIGATTENPSFEVNNALLSRARVYTLKSLSETELATIVDNTLDHQSALLGRQFEIEPAARRLLTQYADGDARRVLNLLENCFDLLDDSTKIDGTLMHQILGDQNLRRFDKQGEDFYDQISALHKSVRGSDPDAALYWLVRMLDGGCDAVYLARRIVRMASEDIGNADPRALTLAINAWEVQERLGSPEGELALAQAVVYLACAAKSNAVYMAYKSVRQDVKTHGSKAVPLHLRNAPTKLMRELDYGKEYRYAHDEPHAYAAGERYFPDDMAPKQYYHPTDRGLESKIQQKLAFLRSLDEQVES